MKTRKVLISLLVLIVVATLIAINPGRIQRENRINKVATIEVAPIDFKISIDTIGALDAARSHTISSTIRGDKGKIIYLIPDGSRVAKDEVLVRLDPTPFEEEVRNLTGQVNSLDAASRAAGQMLELEKNNIEQAIKTAEYNIRVAKLEIRKLVEGDGPIQLAQYKDEMAKSEEEFFRYKSYVTELKSLPGEEDYNNASEIYLAEKKMKELKGKFESASKKYNSYQSHVLPTNIESSKAKVEKYEMEYQQTKQGSIYKIAKTAAEAEQIKGKLQTKKASLLLAEQELEKTVILAPFSGIAILSEIFRQGKKRKSRIGDRVLQNQPLLYFPDISTMVVQAKIREMDLYKVNKGQQCTVKADAYPTSQYQGEISAIGLVATERREGVGGEKFFNLTVTLINKDTRLRPGMTARVVILVDDRKDVVAVPLHAVFEENKNIYCYRLSGEKFSKVPVKLGMRNNNYIEVLSGVKSRDMISVITPPPSLIR